MRFVTTFARLLLAGGLLTSVALQAAEISPAMLSNPCAGCHGTKGVGAGESMPSIAGLPSEYFQTTMNRFRDGQRHSTIMGRIARGYDGDEIKEMAEFFSGQQWVPAEQKTDAKLVARGKEIHLQKCEMCHADNGRASEATVPPLAGQWLSYLEIQLRDYRDLPDKMPAPSPMRKAIAKLSPDDLKALAHFYASQR